MPELPEVTTTVNGLQGVLPGLIITDVWTDLARKGPMLPQFRGTVKEESFFKKLKKAVVGAKVSSVKRRAKNILINLANGQTILIHMKMTGHIIYGRYDFNAKQKIWTPAKDERDALHDPFNKFLHVVFTLSNGKQFVLSDARKFAKVTVAPTKEIDESIHLAGIGPEPLENGFTLTEFKGRLMRRPTGNIKTVLMDQTIIAGIGNIYSDEMLWLADIHPESRPAAVPADKLESLYKAMKEVLKKGIDFGGDSTSDYRDINGEAGKFHKAHNVYRQTGAPCKKKGCEGGILRKVINGRSAHFCDTHQKLYAKK